MGESEVIQVLEQDSFPLSLNEICLKLGDNSNNKKYQVNKIISKLIKHQEIRYIELDRMLARKFLNCKRGIRLYYV